jgi:hypothetical protein
MAGGGRFVGSSHDSDRLVRLPLAQPWRTRPRFARRRWRAACRRGRRPFGAAAGIGAATPMSGRAGSASGDALSPSRAVASILSCCAKPAGGRCGSGCSAGGRPGGDAKRRPTSMFMTSATTRPAAMRVMPFSCLWACRPVMPTGSAKSCWINPGMHRRSHAGSAMLRSRRSMCRQLPRGPEPGSWITIVAPPCSAASRLAASPSGQRAPPGALSYVSRAGTIALHQ